MLQIHTIGSSDTIGFGYGSHSSFSKTMWIKGNGNAWLKGTLTQASDQRIKKDIRIIDRALQKISQLNGYNYHWSDEHRDQSLQIGILAQEVEKVLPELVTKNSDGYLSVNYSGLIPVLIQSIKEQQQQIEEQKNLIVQQKENDQFLRQEIEELKREIRSLKGKK